jgi:type VI secretion system secreted protein Hcp
MQYHASISTKGVNANTKGGLIHGMSYGNTAITPRTLVVSLQRVKAQYDQNAGQLIGKRQHSPLVIIKERDSASPLLLSALSKQEVLSSMVINLVGRPASGSGEVIVSRITLTNAEISKVNRYTPRLTSTGPGPSKHAGINTQELEEIELVFQKISFTNVAGSTSASDDWNWNPR